MPSHTTKVFMSYTGADERVVRQIVTSLQAVGFDVWFAPAELAAGDRLSSIHEKIAESDVFIVALSVAATNSPWVEHEISTAVTLRLSGQALRIVPLFLEQSVRPATLADFISLKISSNGVEGVIPALIAAVGGETIPPDNVISRLSAYVERLIKVPEEVYLSLTSIEGFAAPRWSDGSPRKIDPDMRRRARSSIHRTLTEIGISERELGRALEVFDAGRPLPIVDAAEFPQICDWIRRFADEELLTLSVVLWNEVKKGQRGITIRWIAEDFLPGQLSINQRDNRIMEWQAEGLVSRAIKAGLLARSTEWNHPRTYAYQDAQFNPSFDIGPMVWLIGRLMEAFQVHPQYC